MARRKRYLYKVIKTKPVGEFQPLFRTKKKAIYEANRWWPYVSYKIVRITKGKK